MRYDPCDWFWLREDGRTVFSSKYQIEISIDDALFQRWLAAGGIPLAYPRDKLGNESRDEMNAILWDYGLRAHPLTKEELAVEEEAREAGILTRFEARRLHDIEIERDRRRNL